MAAVRLPSDIGGTYLGRPIERHESGPEGWALLADGVRRALRNHGLWSSDPGRRATEELGHELYARLGYFERRVLAMEAVLCERGLLRPSDLDPRPPELVPPPSGHQPPPEPADPPEDDPPPRYAVGQAVRIRDDWPLRHARTPAYVRGKPGRVAGVHGRFRNPESLAYFGSGRPAQWLYTVEFAQRVLWEDYGGAAGDLLEMDVYEHWIEPREGSA